MLAQIPYNVELLDHSSAHRQYSGSASRIQFVDGVQTMNAIMSNGTYHWRQKRPHTLYHSHYFVYNEGLA